MMFTSESSKAVGRQDSSTRRGGKACDLKVTAAFGREHTRLLALGEFRQKESRGPAAYEHASAKTNTVTFRFCGALLVNECKIQTGREDDVIGFRPGRRIRVIDIIELVLPSQPLVQLRYRANIH
jgi:hypothetical protein